MILAAALSCLIQQPAAPAKPDAQAKPELHAKSEAQAKSEPAPRLSVDQVRTAAQVIGLDFTDAELELMRKSVGEQIDSYAKMQTVALDNAVAPAFVFSPLLPGMKVRSPRFEPREIVLPDVLASSGIRRPANLEDLAFADIPTLAALLKSRQVTSVDLTKMYLGRLKRLDAKLHAVINYTEERALAQAAERDREIAEGKWRGLLHGLP